MKQIEGDQSCEEDESSYKMLVYGVKTYSKFAWDLWKKLRYYDGRRGGFCRCG